MKNLALLILFFLNSTSVFAQKNPQIRACNAAQGEFMVVDALFDQVGLCKLGPSLVGSIDILNKDAQIEIPFSLFNYKKGVQLCTSSNLATFITFEGEEIPVCYYSDGSVIDLETLSSGKNSLRNSQLNQALGL